MSIGVIEKIDSEKSLTGVSRSEQPISDKAAKSDVQWFTAQLHKAQKPESDNVAERVISGISGSSERLQKLSQTADRDLRRAAKTANAEDITRATRSLSNFYLESLLTSKLISKGTQAVEKLTNLQ